VGCEVHCAIRVEALGSAQCQYGESWTGAAACRLTTVARLQKWDEKQENGVQRKDSSCAAGAQTLTQGVLPW
jgi:hypothetical protein